MLVSIQSLILVDEPYYCEPGYEGQMHTDQGNRASKAYSLNIRCAFGKFTPGLFPMALTYCWMHYQQWLCMCNYAPSLSSNTCCSLLDVTPAMLVMSPVHDS